MLVTKIRNKYANDGNSSIKAYIDNEVQRFLNQNRLNQSNLKSFGEKIQLERFEREKKKEIIKDRRQDDDNKSGTSKVKIQRPQSACLRAPSSKAPSQKAPSDKAQNCNLDLQDLKSHQSERTGVKQQRGLAASFRSRAQSAVKERNQKDKESIITPSVEEKESSYSSLEEEDEWTAIQKFNSLLHYEEQKQAAQRVAERKRLMKEQLFQQMEQKQSKKMKEMQEDRLYDEAQRAHLKFLDEREDEKQRQIRENILNEKISRDAQLKKKEHKRRKEARETLNHEIQLVKRLQTEIEDERKVQIQKKKQEKEYFLKMLEENRRNQEAIKVDKERQKLEDQRAQKDYARMLDQQEADRLNEIQQREQRVQGLMNRMANGVLQELDNQQKKEDQMIERYERERELKFIKEQEAKLKKKHKDQKEMKKILYKQQVEKQKKLVNDKKDLNDQANMWQKEREIWQEEDKRLKAKIKQINLETQSFLKQQQEFRNVNNKRMDPIEKAYNKQLIKEISQKKKWMKEAQEEKQKMCNGDRRAAPESELDSINDRI